MKMHYILALTIASAANCAPVAPAELQQVYRPSEVVRNVEAVNGRRIRISGYLKAGVESVALWDSQQHFRDAEEREANEGDEIWNHCVTTYYDYAIERQIAQADGSVIDAIGTIGIYRDETTGIDLWGCNVVHVTLHSLNR